MQDSTTGKKTIGEIVAADFRTARVFEKNGIDFCCGGKVNLETVCTEKGLDLARFLVNWRRCRLNRPTGARIIQRGRCRFSSTISSIPTMRISRKMTNRLPPIVGK